MTTITTTDAAELSRLREIAAKVEARNQKLSAAAKVKPRGDSGRFQKRPAVPSIPAAVWLVLGVLLGLIACAAATYLTS